MIPFQIPSGRFCNHCGNPLYPRGITDGREHYWCEVCKLDFSRGARPPIVCVQVAPPPNAPVDATAACEREEPGDGEG